MYDHPRYPARRGPQTPTPPSAFEDEDEDDTEENTAAHDGPTVKHRSEDREAPGPHNGNRPIVFRLPDGHWVRWTFKIQFEGDLQPSSLLESVVPGANTGE